MDGNGPECEVNAIELSYQTSVVEQRYFLDVPYFIPVKKSGPK